MLAGALLDAADIGLGQQGQGRERDRAEDRLDDAVRRAPLPDEVGAERHEAGAGDAGGVAAGERLGVGLCRAAAVASALPMR